MTTQFYAPYILQLTRPRSKSPIDNILLNSVEFPLCSDNLTIAPSDHLIQFVILEVIFKELVQKKINLYECNYKNFNGRE